MHNFWVIPTLPNLFSMLGKDQKEYSMIVEDRAQDQALEDFRTLQQDFSSPSCTTATHLMAAITHLSISQAKAVIRAVQAALAVMPDGDKDEMIAAARAGV